MQLEYTYMETPVGQLMLAGEGEVLHHLSFPSGKMCFKPKPDWDYHAAAFKQTRHQIDDYFAGQLKRFDLALAPSGTEFQMQVLGALQKIPFGQMRSYKDIAEAIGRPNSMRAVGAANGRNPIPLIIPCHRVVGADGSLTGFGGGLDAKAFLLRLEGAIS
ncbi:methylated-DNA--[protein]-cysteine S-methyltransferase [Candidatus Njordibacter sp. Uisw_039]|jgi:methylated-DNA-[protein]-cysteine S-methyltransferase|uniref:methylated-DNA--[protein]-cysteine S-methyltransferase n=1 Tax=Candidatus Njordibacter sp. Uisw_039 TaxID=3230972 RepID=UPI003D5998FE|tara:strand:- start:13002 stop:13481 length:480 start_codon:yes stop_codon:yes gene_type:complete